MKYGQPKRAGKHGLTACKLALARMWALTNKSYECLSLIYPHLTPRMVRRDIQYVKDLIGVECQCSLAHWLHAHGLGFICPSEREDFLKRDEELRKPSRAA